MSGLAVLKPGLLATVQDLGRPGYAHLGVGWSGAADRGALMLANRLVGNDERAAGIELLLGGASFQATGATTVAVAGAPSVVTVGGRAHAAGEAIYVPDGVIVEIGVPAAGLRCYLAIRGGVDIAPVLRSASTDLLAGLGPEPLRAGDLLLAADAVVDAPFFGAVPQPPPPGAGAVIEVVRGPRDDWVTADSMTRLFTTLWTVTSDVDRVGVRLAGPPLRHSRSDELPSEGTMPGSVQIPASGQPVLFLSDAPITGGYPVVAVLTNSALDRAAQLRPGNYIRFTAVPAPFSPQTVQVQGESDAGTAGRALGRAS